MQLKFYTKETILSAAFLLFASLGARAQSKFEVHESGEKGTHKFSVSLAELYIQEGKTHEIKNSFVPAYTINYDYMITSRWSLGLHNDVPLQDIQKVEELNLLEPVSRERPVASKIMGAYHTQKHLGLLFGVGDEFAHKENFLITSAGAEYEFHLKGSWELGAELMYDCKFHTADSWMMGIGISKALTNHHRG